MAAHEGAVVYPLPSVVGARLPAGLALWLAGRKGVGRILV